MCDTCTHVSITCSYVAIMFQTLRVLNLWIFYAVCTYMYVCIFVLYLENNMPYSFVELHTYRIAGNFQKLKILKKLPYA